ncbi:MAG TPA: hypothetical protein VJ476_08175 [Rhizomicrobium sp.]|nr:hypothetical protein [Rhizomicrobium sp.]
MNKSRFLTLSFLLAISGFGSAYAQAPALAAGTYKLAVGAKAPCELTITADGAVTQAADCATGTTLAKWAPTGSGYQLISTSGETYAVLKPHGESLEGQTFADQRKVVLSH